MTRAAPLLRRKAEKPLHSTLTTSPSHSPLGPQAILQHKPFAPPPRARASTCTCTPALLFIPPTPQPSPTSFSPSRQCKAYHSVSYPLYALTARHRPPAATPRAELAAPQVSRGGSRPCHPAAPSTCQGLRRPWTPPAHVRDGRDGRDGRGESSSGRVRACRMQHREVVALKAEAHEATSDAAV